MSGKQRDYDWNTNPVSEALRNDWVKGSASEPTKQQIENQAWKIRHSNLKDALLNIMLIGHDSSDNALKAIAIASKAYVEDMEKADWI